jgi:hypothetical protein
MGEEQKDIQEILKKRFVHCAFCSKSEATVLSILDALLTSFSAHLNETPARSRF